MVFVPAFLAGPVRSSAAREHGIAASAVLRCGHAGRAGAWAERGTQAGCVTIVTLGGADPPFVVSAAPGARPALHTNPVAIGVPGDGAPLLLSSACEVAAITIGNDMSSRSIEGANPLYLPQAKIYDGSCALGPCPVRR